MSENPILKDKKLCILYANCQGDIIFKLLKLSWEFTKDYHIVQFVNYKKELKDLNILENCDLFIYQYLRDSWLEFSTDVIMSKLPHKCQTLCIPNMFFKGYWPMWKHIEPNPHADLLLEELLKKGLSAKEVMLLYNKPALVEQYNIQKCLEESLDLQADKEKRNICTTVDITKQYYKTEAVYSAVNHPNLRLMLHVVNSIFAALKYDMLVIKVPHDALSTALLPVEHVIHPYVGKVLGLTFYDLNKKWLIYDVELTYTQYLMAYIDSYKQGTDIVAYIHSLK